LKINSENKALLKGTQTIGYKKLLNLDVPWNFVDADKSNRVRSTYLMRLTVYDDNPSNIAILN